MAPRVFCALLCLVLLATHAAATELLMGDVTMVTTVAPGSITLDIEIRDDGGVPDCRYFLVWRSSRVGAIEDCAYAGETVVHWFPRVIGTTITEQFVDTNVEADNVYWYRLDASAFPPPAHFLPGCAHQLFLGAFGSQWDAEFQVPAVTGVVYHGILQDGECYECPGIVPCCCAYCKVSFLSLLPDWAKPFVGTQVKVYGEYCCFGPQWGWSFTPTQIVPYVCPALSTRETTWGSVKSMYR